MANLKTFKQPTKQDLEKLSQHKQILFACFCAKQVFHLVEEKHKTVAQKAIDTAYLFLEGKASKEECRAAAFAASAAAAASAATAAAYYAASAATANAAANAASATTYYAAHAATYAAVSAANSNNKEQILKQQWAFYDQLLNSDRYFEEIVLNG